MNQLLIRGHTPHGRLDDSYSVSELRKPRPLYNFSLLVAEERREEQQQQRQQQLQQQHQQLLQQRQGGMLLPSEATIDALIAGSEFAGTQPGSHNNSAAGASATVRRLQQLQGKRLPPKRRPTNRQLMESHLRHAYGNELFDGQQYVVKGRVGIAGMPAGTASDSAFQAMRGRILGPLPRGTFPADGDDEDSDDDDMLGNASNALNCVFQWCDRNNSAEDVAKVCARRAGAKITMRRGLSKWIFLYFRVRRVSWEFMVYEEKMNCSSVDLFSENVLDRWTVKLRFKMLLDAPMKYPLMAFLSRMGLDTDPDIVFSIDGFFGDMLVGGLRNKNSIPHRQVSFNTTPEAMGLQNGDNIFVVKANSTLRNNVEAHIEMAKRRANKAEGEDEDDEEEDMDEEEDEGQK